MKDIKEYLHLYLGCDLYIFPIETIGNGWLHKAIQDNPGLNWKIPLNYENLRRRDGYLPILRPLSDMTEEDFRLLAIDFFGKENLVFASLSKYWYACSRELDPDHEGTTMEYINDAGDDDPENILMCDSRSKLITYGWIIYEENYHGMSMSEQAAITKYLISKHFDLFGLIESGLAIDKTKLP